MAELADALDLGSSEETRTGSIPARRTKNMKIPPKIGLFRYNVEEGFILLQEKGFQILSGIYRSTLYNTHFV